MNITLNKVGGAPTGDNIITSCGLAIGQINRGNEDMEVFIKKIIELV